MVSATQEDSQIQSTFLTLPREVRNKIYDYVIDIECKPGFAPLLRVSGQVHDEVLQLLLRKYSFVLVEFAWKQDEASMARIVTVLSRSCTVFGGQQVPGMFSSLSSDEAASINDFQYYNMRITITRGKKTKTSTKMMLIGQRAFDHFAILYNCTVPYIIPRVDVNHLNYLIEVFPRESCAAEDAKAMLLPLKEAWHSFSNVKVKCQSAAEVAECAQKHFTVGRWRSTTEIIRSLAESHQVAMTLWDAGDERSAYHLLNNAAEDILCDGASRQFDLTKRSDAALSYLLTVSDVNMAGIAIAQALFVSKLQKDVFLEKAERRIRQALLQLMLNQNKYKDLNFIANLYKAIVDGFIGDQPARRAAFAKAEVYADSLESLKTVYKQILQGKLRVLLSKEILAV